MGNSGGGGWPWDLVPCPQRLRHWARRVRVRLRRRQGLCKPGLFLLTGTSLLGFGRRRNSLRCDNSQDDGQPSCSRAQRERSDSDELAPQQHISLLLSAPRTVHCCEQRVHAGLHHEAGRHARKDLLPRHLHMRVWLPGWLFLRLLPRCVGPPRKRL